MKKLALLFVFVQSLVYAQGEQRYADGTATDQDGNTFEWISYGYGENSFHWAIENADVVTYNDGTPIPQVLYPTEWANLTTGAWCYYNNDPSQERLYNWHAINHPRFAPEGWRVASKDDYTLLIDYLSNNNYIIGGGVGKAMASTTGWNSSTIAGAPGNDQNSNNRSGFNAFPEPYRSADGSFYSGGASGRFWTTTPFNYVNGRQTSAYFFYLSYNWNLDNSNLHTTYTNEGISVRFVRDAVDTEAPVITITVPNPVAVNQGATYTDPGATATDNVDGDISANIVVTNTVDTTTAGIYTVTYNVTDSAGNAATPKVRTVNVLDTERPIITLLGANQIEINQGTTYNEPGATVTDNVDGNIPAVISGNVNTSIPGTYTRFYDAVDTAGNTAIQVTRTVTVKDTEPPVIAINGASTVSVNQGATYTDQGATATDNVDGDLTNSIIIDTSALDTSVPGTYTVTYSVTDSAGNPSTATRTVNVIEYPTVFAGPDQAICKDEQVTLGEATASNYSSLVWTTSGDGVFSNSSIPNPVYTPGLNDITTGSVTLTLTANGANGQQTASDSVRINITSLPTLNAGSDFAVNEDETIQLSEATASNYSSLYWTTSGTGAFSNTTVLNPTYTPSQQDIINGEVMLTMAAISYAPCSGVVADDVLIAINPNPTVNAGPDLSVCQGESVAITGASASNHSSFQWTTSGSGTFINVSTLTPIYTPGAADIASGAVTLTLTAYGANGQQASDTAVIYIEQAHLMVVSSGNEFQTICEGDAILDTDFTVLNGATSAVLVGAPPGIALTPISAGVFRLSGVPTASVSTPTTFVFDVLSSGNQCSSVTRSVSISVHPDDEMFLTSGSLFQTVCEGEPIEDITFALAGGSTNAVVSGLPSGVSYIVNNGIITISGTPTGDISTSVTYSYTLTSIGSCAPTYLQGVITTEPNHEIQLISNNGNQTVDQGASINPVTYSIGGGATGAQIAWDVAPSGLVFNYDIVAGTVTISGAVTGNITTQTVYVYTVTTTGNGCTAAAYTGTITVNPAEINPTEAGILFNGTVSAENNQIKNVADPTDAQDAATKAYADAIVASRGLMNFSSWDNYQVWNDNTSVNLTPNSFVFLNADNTTLVLPDNPENCCFGDVIYIYVMRNASSARPTILKSNNLVIRDRNGNQASSGQSLTGIFQGGGGLNMIINVGDYWMAGSFESLGD